MLTKIRVKKEETMNFISKETALAIVKKIQSDPELIKEFQEKPVKAIEKAGGIDIPDFLEGKLEEIIREQLKAGEGKDPMEVIDKFLK